MAKSYPHITDEYLISLYLGEGMSTKEISEHIGMSAQSIWERLRNSGVKMRSFSEAIKLAGTRGRKKEQRGENNCHWKGGRNKGKDGYIYLIINRRSVPEHRVVWEQHHDKIPHGWIVHHLNGIRDDNRIENLIAMPRNRHSPITAMEPYQQRIRELENIIINLKKEAA